MSNEEPWRPAPIPAAWQGVWRRRSLTRPDGSRDDETLVLWLQTPGHHADIRLPADRPDLAGAAGLDDLDRSQLLALSRQEGFAGGQQWRPGALAWRRVLDFAPAEGPPDEGRLEEAGPGRLIETGLHAGYSEDWRREEGSLGPFAACCESGPMPRFHLRAGDWVALAEERRTAPPAPGRLRALAEAAAARGDRPALRALLDCPISFARIGADGRARVLHSTHPWLEGAELPLPGPGDGQTPRQETPR